MEFSYDFVDITIDDLKPLARQRKADGWRYVQTLAVRTDEGTDLVYSFMDMQTGQLVNSEIRGVKKEDIVPSITDEFLEAFVFENEIHDLFGVTIEGIAIDFEGHFYRLSEKEPMTVLSPEQVAAREKAKKAAEAKAAKAAAKKAEASGRTDAEMEAKLAGMDPEKAAKVRAAMEAKAKKAAAEAAKQSADDQAQKDAELEAKLAGMDPEKAAKVRAAMEAKAKKAAAEAAKQQAEEQAQKDAELEAKLASMDPEKAAKVRAAMEAKAKKEAAAKASQDSAANGKEGE